MHGHQNTLQHMPTLHWVMQSQSPWGTITASGFSLLAAVVARGVYIVFVLLLLWWWGWYIGMKNEKCVLFIVQHVTIPLLQVESLATWLLFLHILILFFNQLQGGVLCYMPTVRDDLSSAYI